MNLEEFLDFNLEKDTADVVILDEDGKEISADLPGHDYIRCQVIDVRYEKVARIKVKRG